MAVFAVSVKPEVVVYRPEVVLRPPYYAATCTSSSLMRLFNYFADIQADKETNGGEDSMAAKMAEITVHV